MAYLSRGSSEDWCHICGGRSEENVEIWYPANAEHQRVDRPIKGPDHYLRICAACGADIRRVGKGDVEHLIADRPGWYKKDPHKKPQPKIQTKDLQNESANPKELRLRPYRA